MTLRAAIRAELAKMVAEHPNDPVLRVLANAEASGMSRAQILEAIGDVIAEQDARGTRRKRGRK